MIMNSCLVSIEWLTVSPIIKTKCVMGIIIRHNETDKPMTDVAIKLWL